MIIAHIVCTYPPYYAGMGNVAFELVNALQEKDHSIRVYTPDYFNKKEIAPVQQAAQGHSDALEEQITTVHRLAPRLQYGNAAYLPTILDELQDVDIVHLHYPFFGTANLLRKWKKQYPEKKLVVHYHMDPRANGWKGLFFRYYSRYWMPKIFHSADAIITASLDYVLHSNAKNIYLQEKEKWHEIPFGVDTQRFFPGAASETLSTQWSLDPQQPTLLFVGGMDDAHYFKGVPILLQALAYIVSNPDSVPLQLVLVGDGALQQHYRALAKGLGIESSVRFVGKVSAEALPEYYRLAQVLILPSIHQGEAFGMVLLEAFASGIPVIATNLPGVRTVAKKAGTVVPVHDPIALAKAIIAFYQEDRNGYITTCRRVAEEQYSWRRVAEQVNTLYKNLLT